MISDTPISAIMTREVVTLNKTDQLEKAEHLFKKRKIRHVPIVQGDAIVGMLSYNDLLRISFADAYSMHDDDVESSVYALLSLDEVMVKNPVSVKPHNTIEEVARVFASREFHALPVVDEDRLVGIITTTDLINYLLKQSE